MVHTFRLKANKVPEIVVGTLSRRNFVVRLGLVGMDDVGELDRVLNEENRDVVTDNIPVALIGI